MENIEMFREPDYSDECRAIWYGPGGVDGDCATEVVHEYADEYLVRRYDLAEFDTVDGGTVHEFICIETVVTATGPDAMRIAASLGSELMFERGGSERFVDGLPV